MKIFTSILILFISTLTFAQLQDSGTIQGVVLDKENNKEPLAFASLYIKDSNITSNTDFGGIYMLTLKPDTYTLVFAFAGYQKIELPNVIVEAGKVTTLKNIVLNTIEGISLEEVIASAHPKK